MEINLLMRQSTSTASPLTPTPEIITITAKPEKSGLRADFALKLLVPLLLAAAFILAYRWGSFGAYVRLLSRNTYSSWLPGRAAG